MRSLGAKATASPLRAQSRAPSQGTGRNRFDVGDWRLFDFIARTTITVRKRTATTGPLCTHILADRAAKTPRRTPENIGATAYDRGTRTRRKADRIEAAWFRVSLDEPGRPPGAPVDLDLLLILDNRCGALQAGSRDAPRSQTALAKPKVDGADRSYTGPRRVRSAPLRTEDPLDPKPDNLSIRRYVLEGTRRQPDIAVGERRIVQAR